MSVFDAIARLFKKSEAPEPLGVPPPPIDTPEEKHRRITALLTGRGAYLAMELCGVNNVPKERMRQTFPFTRQEILDHLAQHNLPIETFIAGHRMELTESNGKAIVTEHDERSGPWDSDFPDLASARAFLTKYCLSHTYTGLDFNA